MPSDVFLNTLNKPMLVALKLIFKSFSFMILQLLFYEITRLKITSKQKDKSAYLVS